MKKRFISKLMVSAFLIIGLTSVTASAGVAINQWYGNGDYSTSHTCNGWTYAHDVGVRRTATSTYTSGYSWVSYSSYVAVQTNVRVGNRVATSNGTGYAQTNTVTDLAGAPVSESHY